MTSPKFRALPPIGFLKIEHKFETTQKCRVYILAKVRRQDREPFEPFQPRQQIGGFQICITVMRVDYLSALAKKRICLIKEKRRLAAFRSVKNCAEIFLGLADPFGDYAR